MKLNFSISFKSLALCSFFIYVKFIKMNIQN